MQLIANSLIAASLYSAIGLSFSLVYRSAGFFHFAHGATITLGAYACYCSVSRGVPLWGSVMVAALFSAGVGALMQLGVFSPLTRRGASAQVLLLASLGVYVVIENALGMVFGYSPKSLRSGMVREGINILGARVTPAQGSLFGFAAFAFLIVWLFLRFSRAGLRLRAVASDRELSNASGIGADNVALGAMVMGSALAGLFGMLLAMDLDLSPGMGLQPLMMGMVAVIIGRTNRVWSVALAALVLAAAQQCSAWMVGAQWQDGATFIVLLIFVMARPRMLSRLRLKRAAI